MKLFKICLMSIVLMGINVTAVLAQTVESGRIVTFDYELFVDNELIESSDDSGPLEYEHGAEQIIPGLENALDGKSVGDQINVTLDPEEAYGEVDENAFREIPKSDLPEDGPEPQVGMVLELVSPDGESFPVIIAEVKENAVVLDFNHPLAGKELTFDVTITAVE